MLSVYGGREYALALGNGGAWLLDVAASLIIELPVIASDGRATPVAALCEDLDFAAIASSSRIIRGYSVREAKMRWERTHPESIPGLSMIRERAALVVGGDEVRALRADSGDELATSITGYHSHVDVGRGCVCVKSKTEDVYFFQDLSKPIKLKTPSCRVRFGASSADLIALHFFDRHHDVFLFDAKSGVLVGQHSVPGISLIDALSFDQTGQLMLLAAHSLNSKRIEIWQVTLTNAPTVISILPEGVGQTGWVFHDKGTRLLSRNGGLAEVSSGRLMRDDWTAWK